MTTSMTTKQQHAVHAASADYQIALRTLLRHGMPESDARDELLRRARAGLTFRSQRHAQHDELLARYAVAYVQKGR